MTDKEFEQLLRTGAENEVEKLISLFAKPFADIPIPEDDFKALLRQAITNAKGYSESELIEVNFGILETSHWADGFGYSASVGNGVWEQITFNDSNEIAVVTRSVDLGGGETHNEPKLTYVPYVALGLNRSWAYLDLQSTPSEADIDLNVTKGKTRVKKFLRPGAYEIEAAKEGFVTQQKKIDVHGGNAYEIKFELDKVKVDETEMK
ncbi:PEGA domain-containing protein [Bremerella volcania]|nr:PEGA domain-containing protein [Bremerella volcania]